MANIGYVRLGLVKILGVEFGTLTGIRFKAKGRFEKDQQSPALFSRLIVEYILFAF